ncbi:MAG: PaaI family thioesterase [Syntrophomonas sp.]
MELNKLHIRELIQLINCGPYFQNLSMSIEDMGIGYSVVKIDIENKHLSPYGAIQGGVYSSMIDAATYWAPYAEVGEDAGLITMDVNVNYIASIKTGRLLARGERLRVGKTVCISQATITDEHGNILANGTSKLLLTQGLQKIPQMKGYSNIKIPPKFIRK